MRDLYLYKEKNNPKGGGIAGVPNRNLTAEEFNAFPDWVKGSIERAPYFVKVKPNPKKKGKAPEAKAPETEPEGEG